MARIDLMKHAIAAGVGVVDEGAIYMDAKSGKTASFKGYRDWVRLGLVGVGLGAQFFMPRYARLGETLSVAATPLLVKSIVRPLLYKAGGTTIPAGLSAREFVARRAVIPNNTDNRVVG